MRLWARRRKDLTVAYPGGQPPARVILERARRLHGEIYASKVACLLEASSPLGRGCARKDWLKSCWATFAAWTPSWRSSRSAWRRGGGVRDHHDQDLRRGPVVAAILSASRGRRPLPKGPLRRVQRHCPIEVSSGPKEDLPALDEGEPPVEPRLHMAP